MRCRNSGGCTLQGKRIWHNFVAKDKQEHTWAWPPTENLPFFFLWTTWGVSTRWLRQMSQRLVHHFASFQGEAAVHRSEAAYEGDLAVVPDRADLKLLRAWIVWRVLIRLVERAPDSECRHPLGVTMNLVHQVEPMLADMWEWYPQHMLQRRLRQCRSLGEDVTRLVVDGNMKLSRRICGRPVAELTHSRELNLFTATPCSCTPVFKGRRCSKHRVSSPPDDPGPAQSEVIISHRRRRVLRDYVEGEPYDVQLKAKDWLDDPAHPTRWTSADMVTAGQLHEYWAKQEKDGYVAMKSPPHDLASTSCTTHKEGTRGYKKLVRQGRLCGWLIATTSNGFVVHAKEFVGAESIPQRYFFLAEIAAHVPELRVVVHDDACHLRKFATKQQGQSTVARRLAFPHVQYIIDKMHARGHVDQWCKANCHPEVPSNAEAIRGLKTPACETKNSVLGRHKFALRHMRKRTASFYLLELIDVRNASFGQ